MNPSFGRGRGRRQVLQLGNSGTNSSYLARYGYQSLSEDAFSSDRKVKSKQEKAGLSRLVGAYDDSDSEGDVEDAASKSSQSSMPGEIPPLPPAPVAMETSQVQPPSGEGQALDTEVASFLAEINAISTDDQVVDHNDIPLPPGAFIPRDRTAEVIDRQREKVQAEEVKPEPRPQKKSHSYSMFVKGGSERLGEKGSQYTSQFVKGGTEVLRPTDITQEVEEEESYQLPEAPTTVWQQCQDENTKYMYYWNFVTNEVTWNIPPDYTQYLLLQKEYEDKLARIPEDVRKRLEAKKLAASQTEQCQINGNDQIEKEIDSVTSGPQLQPVDQDCNTSSPSQTVVPSLPESRVDSPRADSSDIKLKPKQKKSNKVFGPRLPDCTDISSTEPTVPAKAGDSVVKNEKITVSEVDMFVSELLSKDIDGVGERGSIAPEVKGGKMNEVDSRSSSENGVKDKMKDSEEMDFDIDDIDAALELALERKTAELKKLDDIETKDSKHLKSKKHDRREKDKKKDKHRIDYHHKSDSSHKSESRHRDRSESKHKSDSRPKRSSLRESEDKKEQVESQAKKARLVAAYDESEEEEATTSTTSTTAVTTVKAPVTTEPVLDKVSVKSELQPKEEPQTRPVPRHLLMKDEVEDAANIALGKLEFLEVTKKGLSKLQVLLLELQTRFRDWQDGGLDTQFFLCRLQEANRQLEQYEQSAVPPGYSCHWDRNFRRYFYTSEKTGESQWDYPEPSLVSTTSSVPPTTDASEVSSSREPVIPEATPPSPKPLPPPPPPPPDEEEELPVYGPHLPSDVMTETSTTKDDGENLANLIDGEPMPPDSSDENISEEPPKPPEPDNSEQTSEVPPVFPGEPPPPGTEVLFGLPPPPPPSVPYPGDDDTRYSVDHDSPDEADMDVDDPDTPKSAEAEDSVSSSHQDYHHPSIQASSSSTTDHAPSTSVSHQSSEAVESTPVIYRPPQLNIASSSSTFSTAPVTAAASVISAQPVLSAQPVTGAQPSMSAESVSQISSQVDMFADTRMSEEISSTCMSDIPPQLPPQQTEGEKTQKKEKKKKKDKSITSSSLSLKKKNVSSLVQKWQQVKVQVEEEEKVNEERQMAIRQKLEEWKREQAHS